MGIAYGIGMGGTSTFFLVTYDFDDDHGEKREAFRLFLEKRRAIRLSESAYLLDSPGAAVIAVWQMLDKFNDEHTLIENNDQVWVTGASGQQKVAGDSTREDAPVVIAKLKKWGVLDPRCPAAARDLGAPSAST